ncbi:DUF2461 family protein [Streptomyces umbrinus]|uniref:DUF2461 family protein n=1 Tax=Streptomyces umbrinus TaxID=67370 RepID=UPI003C2D1E43
MRRHTVVGSHVPLRALSAYVDELTRRARHIELAGEPRRHTSHHVWGYASLPVSHPARGLWVGYSARMCGQFTGWPEQAMDVLWQLQGEPTYATREHYRADRERLVRQPMIALLNEVADTDPRYEDFSVWHYRTNSWWWQNQSAVIRLGRKIEIGLRFSLDGLRIQGAWWYPDPGQVDMFRKAVASEGSGRELSAIVEDLRKKGYDISGDVMKRPPRGYPTDHPRTDLLRHRSLIAARPLGCEEWLHTPEALDRVLSAAADLDDLLTWLVRHVKRTA